MPATRPVGTKIQNMWGLYDMLGNVGEWCSDNHWLYTEEEATDPVGCPDGLLKVIRGGSFTDLAAYCRYAMRNALEPEYRNRFTGFRLAAERTGK